VSFSRLITARSRRPRRQRKLFRSAGAPVSSARIRPPRLGSCDSLDPPHLTALDSAVVAQPRSVRPYPLYAIRDSSLSPADAVSMTPGSRRTDGHSEVERRTRSSRYEAREAHVTLICRASWAIAREQIQSTGNAVDLAGRENFSARQEHLSHQLSPPPSIVTSHSHAAFTEGATVPESLRSSRRGSKGRAAEMSAAGDESDLAGRENFSARQEHLSHQLSPPPSIVTSHSHAESSHPGRRPRAHVTLICRASWAIAREQIQSTGNATRIRPPRLGS
jgi:hypothetical protein